ncbi:serine/threonine-protein kinase pakF-like [Magallana gigas]|uniref:serine/threonine-protein kinase pakF-like n=1 Tax=Magallana gigas TaxID=29159 RepID=UPI00334235B2
MTILLHTSVHAVDPKDNSQVNPKQTQYKPGIELGFTMVLAAGDVEKRANEDTPNNENSDWNPKKDDGDIGKDSEEIQEEEEEEEDEVEEEEDGKNNEDNDIKETEDVVGAFVVGMREKNKQDIAQDWIP